MTGFGSASSIREGVLLHVEIRTVNNKFYKSNFRVPEILQGLETEIEQRIASYITRGSVTFTIKYSDASENAAATINTDALKSYVAQLKSVGDDISIDAARLLSLPGVLIQDQSDAIITSLKPNILDLVDEACSGVVEMRTTEGKALKQDLEQQLTTIREHLKFIKKRAPEIVADYECRLKQRMESLLEEIGKSVAAEDVIKEVAVFSEKTDIAEEIKRLDGHLKQFDELSSRLDGEPVGRTLDFLAQEMLRESNTIASKCLDGETSRRIVEIKGAIDRIKEQVQNAE